MKKVRYAYRQKLVCPHCLSLSIKQTKENMYKCYNCEKIFKEPKKVWLWHKDTRCIDNNVETRLNRLKNDKVIYE